MLWIPSFLNSPASKLDQIGVDEVPAEHEDAVQQAADECPVEAIIVN